MMKSLWAGVSGLQAHQIAMDVEGHNIANVNTVGFKYARANFADMLSQTVKIATAPQGESGGKNDLQVGLGAMVSSTTRIFNQGSTQDTGKNTDLAIQGDGFFIVTNDGGQTFQYSRNGDFNLDANGNMTDNNGMIVQGWKKEIRGSDESCGGEEVNTVDSTQPITNIEIQPGLKIPARKTSNIELKANLSGGMKVETKECIYPTMGAKDGINFQKAATTLDVVPSPEFGSLFDEHGHRIALQDGDGTRITIVDPSDSTRTIDVNFIYTNSYDPQSMDIKDEMWDIYKKKPKQEVKASAAAEPDPNAPATPAAAGAQTPPPEPEKAEEKNKRFTVKFSNVEQLMTNLQQMLRNISLDGESRQFADALVGFGGDMNAIKITNGSNQNVMKLAVGAPTMGQAKNNTFLTRIFEGLLGDNVSSDKVLGVRVGAIAPGGEAKTRTINTQTYASAEDMGVLFDSNGEAFQLQSATTSAVGLQDGQGFKVSLTGLKSDGFNKVSRELTFRYTNEAGQNPPKTKTITQANNNTDNPVYFHTTEDLRTLLQQFYRDINSDGNIDNNVDVTIDNYGRIQVQNNEKNDVKNISVKINGLQDTNTTQNERFLQAINSLDGLLEVEKIRTTQSMNAATHASSIEVYDSLGSKHMIRLEFRKTDANRWDWRALVGEPATLTGANPEGNILRNGQIQFSPDGALINYNPPTLTFSPNNGAKGDQIIQLNFGKIGGYEGVTSLDAKSTTSGISQNGYPSGDLLGIRVDQTGAVVGSFSNGRSMALAQVAVAKFTNNSGLSANGGNLFKQTSNSGEPIIGTPGSGGRGSIMSSALEMSNVDLSKALTNLIVIQRGFQANSKTITTSDQLLDTLIGLKR